jgi:hypothetical protein
LRAQQGDLGGARKILQELLDGEPPQPEARRLLEQLERNRLPALLPAAAMATGDRRLVALHDLLRRVTHNAGTPR